MSNLTKESIRQVIETIKGLYLEDKIPWICGYSGGKAPFYIVTRLLVAKHESGAVLFVIGSDE